jgi:hypothetical protein
LKGKQRAPSTSSNSGASTSRAPDPPPQVEAAVEDPPVIKEFWLTKCQLEIDGSPIGNNALKKF